MIFYGILTANERALWLKKKNKKGALLKLDFKKDYDSIRWSFLEHILNQIGLGPRIIKWILWCVKTLSISTMINGCTEPFHIEKGLR